MGLPKGVLGELEVSELKVLVLRLVIKVLLGEVSFKLQAFFLNERNLLDSLKVLLNVDMKCNR